MTETLSTLKEEKLGGQVTVFHNDSKKKHQATNKTQQILVEAGEEGPRILLPKNAPVYK